MNLQVMFDNSLKLLNILLTWPFLSFIALLILLKPIKKGIESLLPRLKKGPGGLEFSDFGQDLIDLINQNYIQKENVTDLKIDPYSIRINHTSAKIDKKYWLVNINLEAPVNFINSVEKVVYERHPTFKQQFVEKTMPPFADTFKCWGEFTLKAQIILKNGQVLRRQRYISLSVTEYVE